MIGHLPEMIGAGINSFKIEGRLKGLSYLASVVKTYREAIDAYYESPAEYHVLPQWQKEVSGINQRGYCTGFYLKDSDQIASNYDNEKPGPQTQLAGKIIDVIDSNWIKLDARNKLETEDRIEILPVKGDAMPTRIKKIITGRGEPVTFVQPETLAIIELETQISCSPDDIVRFVA